MSGEPAAAAEPPETATAEEAVAPAIAGVPQKTEPPASPSRLARFLRSKPGLIAVYVVFAGAYLGASGARLRRHSQYNHYVYLAEGWLHGRLALAGQPPNENDWAKVDVFKLKDGRELRGTYGSRTGGPVDRFYPLRGAPVTVPPEQIVSRSTIRYVSFPPLPGGVDVAVRRDLRPQLQRHPLHRAVGRAEPGAAHAAAARPAPARPVETHRRRRPVAGRHVRRRFGLLLLLRRRRGLVHRADRLRDARDRLRVGIARCQATDAGRALHGPRLRDAAPVAGFPALCAGGRARVGRLVGPAHARRVAPADAAPAPLRRALRRRSSACCSGTTTPGSNARSSSATSS